MKLIVNPHTIEIQKDLVNEKEINITKCEFEFAEEITDDLVKKALFTLNNGTTYDLVIVNNECDIPYEVLQEKGQIEIGVIAYQVEDDEYIKRFNPSPAYFSTLQGSLKESENAGTITPSDLEQYEQALQDGLTTVNGKIEDINTALQQVDNLDIDASKLGDTATVTITKKNGTEKSVLIKDGDKGDTGNPGRDGVDGYSPTASVSKSGSTATISITDKNGTTTATVSDGQNGTNGITPTIGDNGNWYLGSTDTGKPSRGVQGETGASGADGRDGYVQYTAGDNITILNNVISATGGDKFYLGKASSYTQQNPLDLDELPLGEYILGIDNFSNSNNYRFYVKYTYNGTPLIGSVYRDMSGYIPMVNFIVFNYNKKGETAPFYVGDVSYLGIKERLEVYLYQASIKVETNEITSNVGTYYQIKCVNTNTAQDITGEKTFYTIPKQSDTTAPTLDTQFTNKKYVDDKIGDINTILATLTTPGGE